MLNQKDQKELLRIARQTLKRYLFKGQIPEIKVTSESLKKPHGVFVTLKINDQLRGCIGVLESDRPLCQEVQKQALAAAIHDPRFVPLRPSELAEVIIEISVLSPMKKVNSWQEIELGKHGVMISQGNRGGVFLPQVAEETGWDLPTFLTNLCQHKASLPPLAWKDPQTEIKVFEAQVIEEKARG